MIASGCESEKMAIFMYQCSFFYFLSCCPQKIKAVQCRHINSYLQTLRSMAINFSIVRIHRVLVGDEDVLDSISGIVVAVFVDKFAL